MSRMMDTVRQVVRESKTTIEVAQKEAERTCSPLRLEMQRSRDHLIKIEEELVGKEDLNKEEAEAVLGCVAPVVAKFELRVNVPAIESCIGSRTPFHFVRSARSALVDKIKQYK